MPDGFPPHFGSNEFLCKCGKCDFPVGHEARLRHLAWTLEAIRHWAGGPIRIASAYRCPTHNASVGGSSKSQHVEGQAADLHHDLGPEHLLQVIEDLISEHRIPNGGVGHYDWGIHYDIRPYPARWDGRTKKEE